MAFMFIVFCFPTNPNPDAQTMNYTIVILAGSLILSLVYYYLPGIGGKRSFTGPVISPGYMAKGISSEGVREKDENGERNSMGSRNARV